MELLVVNCLQRVRSDLFFPQKDIPVGPHTGRDSNPPAIDGLRITVGNGPFRGQSQVPSPQVETTEIENVECIDTKMAQAPGCEPKPAVRSGWFRLVLVMCELGIPNTS